MAVGDIITAARYNLIQGRIETVMGLGSGDFGYGQTLTSSQVNVEKIIEADDLNALYTDMSKARIHQTGSVPSVIAQVAEGDIIEESGSVEPTGFADFESLMSDIETNRFDMAESQSTTSTGITSQRSTPWNTTLTHTIDINFTDTDTIRHFFNAGGELRLQAGITGGSGSKTTNWKTMLSNMGIIKLNYANTTSTGTGADSGTGFYDLGSSWATIFTKSGSGIYSENLYKVEARRPTATKVQLRASFQDLDPTAPDIDNPSYPPVDENVDGVLLSTCQYKIASGVNVSLVDRTPAFSNATTI